MAVGVAAGVAVTGGSVTIAAIASASMLVVATVIVTLQSTVYARWKRGRASAKAVAFVHEVEARDR